MGWENRMGWERLKALDHIITNLRNTKYTANPYFISDSQINYPSLQLHPIHSIYVELCGLDF